MLLVSSSSSLVSSFSGNIAVPLRRKAHHGFNAFIKPNYRSGFYSRKNQNFISLLSSSKFTTSEEEQRSTRLVQQQQQKSSSSSSPSCWKDAYTPEFIERARNSLGPGRKLLDNAPPFGWSDLVQIVRQDQNYAALYRSLEMQTKYVYHRDVQNEEWESFMDYILHDKFKYEKKRTIDTSENYDEGEYENDNKKWQAIRPKNLQNTRILVPNEFPYHVESNIEHWCLWRLQDNVNDEDIEWALKELAKVDVALDTIHWTNPPHLQSVPEIYHAHILCLRRRTLTR